MQTALIEMGNDTPRGYVSMPVWTKPVGGGFLDTHEGCELFCNGTREEYRAAKARWLAEQGKGVERSVNELILIDDDSKFPVNGRNLHERLKVDTPYHKWFPRMCEYGFSEDVDYRTKMSNRSDGLPGKQRVDNFLSLGMAKEICMLQRTEEGRQVRRYLIEIEEQWNQPEAVMARALQMADRKLAEITGQMRRIHEDNTRLAEKVQADAPKVLFADSVAASEDSILIGNFAKILRQNGVDTGQNRFFERLRKDGYLCHAPGERYNTPTQKAMDRGLFEVQTRVVQNGDEPPITRYTTKVTGKGQVYFMNKYGRRELRNAQ